MPYLPDPAAIGLAFGSGSTVWMDRPITFTTYEIGKLRLTTGALAASDPFVTPNPPPFTRRVPLGTYPVTVAVAHLGGESVDERVAFARLDVATAEPERWEPARLVGQAANRLSDDEFFGYGVDSGTGCFMDAAAGPLLEARMVDFMQVIDDMQRTYRPTWSWLDLQPDVGHDANVLLFSTGWGDGSYPTFFGLDATGEVVAVLTDFMLLDVVEDAPNVAPARPARPERPWWRFWR